MENKYLFVTVAATMVAANSLVDVAFAESTERVISQDSVRTVEKNAEKNADKLKLAKLHKEVKDGLRPAADEEKAYNEFK